jgi:hypothetical protein
LATGGAVDPGCLPQVRDAVWAWKLHVKLPRPGGSAPDYRAFLVSLFGLDRLVELTAASKAREQAQPVTHGRTPAEGSIAVGASGASPTIAAAGNSDHSGTQSGTATTVAVSAQVVTSLTPTTSPAANTAVAEGRVAAAAAVPCVAVEPAALG